MGVVRHPQADADAVVRVAVEAIGGHKKSADGGKPANRAWLKRDQAFGLLSSFGASLLAQPPLPLQEFLPAQPLSPALQLPWPLQPFLPLQSCFAAFEESLEPLEEPAWLSAA